jgi:hypothetical protein
MTEITEDSIALFASIFRGRQDLCCAIIYAGILAEVIY